MTVKEKAQKVISGLPEEATLDDIQYHLYVLECIERGEKISKREKCLRKTRYAESWQNG